MEAARQSLPRGTSVVFMWIACLALCASLGDARTELEAKRSMMKLQAPAQIPADIATITARFKLMQAMITRLQAQAVDVTKVIEQVETTGTDTLSRVDDAEKKLIETSNKAALNKHKIMEIRNQTEQAEGKVKEVLDDMKGLMKIVEDLDSTSATMGSQAQKVAGQVADLEDKVQRLMPGSSGLTDRIKKAESVIAKYQEEVKAGLPGMVEKSLRGHFNSASENLQKLTEDVEKANTE